MNFHNALNAFIHSIALLQVYYYSEALMTTALILRQSEHAEALQATTSEELVQGPYVVAGVGSNLQPSGCKAPLNAFYFLSSRYLTRKSFLADCTFL